MSSAEKNHILNFFEMKEVNFRFYKPKQRY